MKPPKVFCIAVAFYAAALGKDAWTAWQGPAALPYKPPVAAVTTSGVQAHFPIMRYAPSRTSTPFTLDGAAPSRYEAQLTLEEPLFYTSIKLEFAPRQKANGLLRVPLPRGAWVDKLTVNGQSPRTVLASTLLPAHGGRSPANDLLEVQVPTTDSAVALVEIGYVQVLGAASECVLPLPELPRGKRVQVDGLVNTWRKPPGKLVEQANGPETGDIKVRRFNGGHPLAGVIWTALPGKPSGPTGFVVSTEGGDVSWVQTRPHGSHQQQSMLLRPDKWSSWAQLPPEVHLGKRRPTPKEQALILDGKILCPYSRLGFSSLQPGGIRPGH